MPLYVHQFLTVVLLSERIHCGGVFVFLMLVWEVSQFWKFPYSWNPTESLGINAGFLLTAKCIHTDHVYT